MRLHFSIFSIPKSVKDRKKVRKKVSSCACISLNSVMYHIYLVLHSRADTDSEHQRKKYLNSVKKVC